MDRNQPSTFWGVAAYRMWSAAAISWMSLPMSYAKMASQLASGRKIGDKSDNKSIPKAASASAPLRETKPREASAQPAAVGAVARKASAPNTSITQTENKAPVAPKPATPRAVEIPGLNPRREPERAPVHASLAKETVSHAQPTAHGKAGKDPKHPAKGLHAHHGSNGKIKGR